MKKQLFLLLMIFCAFLAYAGNYVLYTADDSSIFPNPERGFTEELGGETRLSDSNNHIVLPEAEWFFDLTDPENADRQSQTLVVLVYYLYNYRSKDLSSALLQGFDEDMQSLRDHGFKCVLRFAYDWKSRNDADLNHVLRHIEQLTPHLEANKDVIYVIETGFVGQWGEWYYSSNFGNETQQLNDSRRQVLQAMLNACPKDRFLLVRYPLIKLSYLGDEQPLDSALAFTDTARARIGHHNDAFLNAWGNDGTYGRDGDGPDDDPLLRQYIANETLYVPNGGETNVEDNDDTPGLPAQIYQQAETEMSLYHWSFCGSTYSEEVTDLWRNSGIFDELNRKMGYRYQLISADLPQTAYINTAADFTIQLRNVGYAPLYNKRTAFIVLKNEENQYALPLASDPRRWLPNGAETTINEQLTIPAEVQAGNYSLYLWLPDQAETLKNNHRYAIRFANTNIWDAESGMNNLNATVQILSGPQGIDNQDIMPLPRKILLNGQILIYYRGIYYNTLGLQVTNL